MLSSVENEHQINQRECPAKQFSITNNDPLSSFEPIKSKPTCSEKCRKALSTPKFWISFAAASWGFLTSVERSVILSTLYLYFKTFWNAEAAQNFYGVTMSAFSLAILIMTPVFGYLAHSGIKVKLILIICNQMEVLGNLLYLIGATPWLVLLGRFISGIGASCEPPLYADIARVTNVDERTPIIIAILISRQCGLMFGPAFTLVLHNMNVTIAGFSLNVYNGPGLLMAGLWILHTIILLFTYPIVDEFGKVIDANLNKWSNRASTNSCMLCPTYCRNQTKSVDTESDLISTSDCTEDTQLIASNGSASRSFKSRCRCHFVSIKPYLAYNLVTMYAVSFAVYFCFMSLEAALPPVANRYFNWDEVQVSYTYLGGGVLVLVFCVLLHLLTKCISDRWLVLVGCIILVISYIWLTACCALLTTAPMPIAISITMIGIAIHVAGMPFATACSESLYSKLVEVTDMNRAQSILRTVINVAFLLGPFFGGTLHYVAPWVFGVMAFLMAIPVVLLIIRFANFQVADRIDLQEENRSQPDLLNSPRNSMSNNNHN